MDYHKPVMLAEVINGLRVKKDGKYIDCTLGDGGHTLAVLALGGTVLGIDVDENALKRATERINKEGFGEKFVSVQGNFRNIDKLAGEKGFESVDGVLYDLGYSSYQLNEEDLGLSFLGEQVLDMRLDKNLGVTAADLLNALPEEDLANMFYDYSDERLARRFARAIVESRNLKKFQTTKDLSDLLVSVAPSNYEHGRIHPATRVFQALRIAVNGELDNLSDSLPRAEHLLLPGGRMVIISFHSLEDKIAKNFGKNARLSLDLVTEKPLVPTDVEVKDNSRSRSAKLRVFEKKLQ